MHSKRLSAALLVAAGALLVPAAPALAGASYGVFVDVEVVTNTDVNGDDVDDGVDHSDNAVTTTCGNEVRNLVCTNGPQGTVVDESATVPAGTNPSVSVTVSGGRF